MQYIFSDSDIASFSSNTREELLTKIRDNLSNLNATKSELSVEDVNIAADLTEYQVERFMSGVSEGTSKNLEIFINNEGRMSHSEFKDQSKLEKTAASFFTPITKRVRNILGDKEVFLFAWEKKTQPSPIVDGDRDHYFHMTSQTYNAFKNYFLMK